MSSIRIEGTIQARRTLTVLQDPLVKQFTINRINILSGKLPGVFLTEVWFDDNKKFIPWAQKIEKLVSLKDLTLPANTKLKLVFRNDNQSPVNLIIEIEGK